MGSELGQWREWIHEESLEWHVLQFPFHAGVQQWVKDVNRVYRSEGALHERDFSQEGFEWIDFRDWEESAISFIRRGKESSFPVLVACNFTPVVRHGYRVGVPVGGYWQEILNSDAEAYGGSNVGNAGGVSADPIAWHGRDHSLLVTLPPLGVLFFRPGG
jgi:1,4-alpha-glucan branching enzyme